MCAGAAVNARISRIVFGCADPKAGSCGTLGNIPQAYSHAGLIQSACTLARLPTRGW